MAAAAAAAAAFRWSNHRQFFSSHILPMIISVMHWQ